MRKTGREAYFTAEQLWEAWERVRENEGCAGADGVTIPHFARNVDRRLEHLNERVAGGVYRAFPLVKIVVEKKPAAAETRTLLVPTVADRVLQTAVARHLSRSFEEEFLECSYGYRPGRSVDSAWVGGGIWSAIVRWITAKRKGFILRWWKCKLYETGSKGACEGKGQREFPDAKGIET